MENQIEEAVVVEESGVVLSTDFEKPTLPALLNKEDSIAKIKASLKKYQDIKISGTADKDNYKLVVAGIKELKDSKIAWTKSVKENVLAPATAFLTDLKSDFSEIETAFKTAEQELRDKKDAIDNQVALEKKAEDERKTKELSLRIEALISLGGKLAGDKYVFAHDLTVSLSIASLKDFTQEQWDEQLSDVQFAYNVEQKRLNDIKVAQDNLAKENLALEAQLKDKVVALRMKELRLEGFDLHSPNEYVKNGVYVITDNIHNLSDDAWDSLIEQSAIIPTDAPEKVEEVKPAPAMKPSERFEDDAPTKVVDAPKTTKAFVMPKLDDVAEVEYEEEVQAVILGHSIHLLFSDDKPFIETNVGTKFCLRIFPNLYAKRAIDMPMELLMNSGDFNSELSFVLFKSV